MSAPTDKLRRPDQTAGWQPQLQGLNLPPALTNAITQAFQLIYSARDTQNQLTNNLLSVVSYGTHADRTRFDKLNLGAVGVMDGSILLETDRASAMYQSRQNPRTSTNQWFWAGGIYADVLANRPTDLGPNDLGFLFLGIDQQQLFRWDGSTWVHIVPV